MSYLSVIPRQTAKDHLRVDDIASDTQIDRMIESALSLIEKRTNILVFQREETYSLAGENCIRVYDFPINSVVKGLAKDGTDVTLTLEDNYDFEQKTLYTNYTSIDGDAVSLVLNVGYADPTDVPSELIEAALEMIDYWYYGNDGKISSMLIPESVNHVLMTNKRYVL